MPAGARDGRRDGRRDVRGVWQPLPPRSTSTRTTVSCFLEGGSLHDIRVEEGLNRENAEAVCSWTNRQGAYFLEQWAGPELTFPLTVEALQGLSNPYSIFLSGEFVGLIQKIRVEQGTAHIGRFLIDPEHTGKGIGKHALTEFINMICMDSSISSISLAVLAHNIRARSLYEKLGFATYEVADHPQEKLLMKRMRTSFFRDMP